MVMLAMQSMIALQSSMRQRVDVNGSSDAPEGSRGRGGQPDDLRSALEALLSDDNGSVTAVDPRGVRSLRAPSLDDMGGREAAHRFLIDARIPVHKRASESALRCPWHLSFEPISNHTSECRLTILGGSTCRRVHVALHARVRRPMLSRMSLHQAMDRQLPGRSCRSPRWGRATCSAPHVALHERVERHCHRGMSLSTSGQSDIVADACRTAHVPEATCSRDHVAFHERVERHARAGMSRFARLRSDLLALACRSARV